MFEKHFKEYSQIIKTLLRPDAIYEAVEDIDVEHLYSRGYRSLFLDVDNTLMTYHQRQVSLQKVQWVHRVKPAGFKIILISNNVGFRRINKVCNQLELPGIYLAMKPFVFSLKEIAKDHEIDFDASVLVGDQLLTDVILGKWLKAYTVLVNPLDRKLSFVKTIQRDVELFLLRKVGVVPISK